MFYCVAILPVMLSSVEHYAKGHGLSDGFVAKYNTNGSLQWVQMLGGIKVDKASDCAADNSNAVFVTGYFEDSMSVGNKGVKSKGLSDIYVAKIDAGGNRFG